MDLLGYLGAVFIGTSLGLLGGGGSILAVPLFSYFFSMPAVQATSSSLFVVGVASGLAFWSAYRDKQVDLQMGIFFALPSLAGVLIVRRFVMPQIPETFFIGSWSFSKESLIMGAFALVMLSASLVMFQSDKKRDREKPGNFQFILNAIFVGMVTGFVGAGGGFLIVPALVSFGRLPVKRAVGSSLGIITFNSLLGFASDIHAGYSVDFKILLVVTTISILGIYIGRALSKKISETLLKPLFGVFILILGTGIFAQQLMKL